MGKDKVKGNGFDGDPVDQCAAELKAAAFAPSVTVEQPKLVSIELGYGKYRPREAIVGTNPHSNQATVYSLVFDAETARRLALDILAAL